MGRFATLYGVLRRYVAYCGFMWRFAVLCGVLRRYIYCTVWCLWSEIACCSLLRCAVMCHRVLQGVVGCKGLVMWCAIFEEDVYSSFNLRGYFLLLHKFSAIKICYVESHMENKREKNGTS